VFSSYPPARLLPIRPALYLQRLDPRSELITHKEQSSEARETSSAPDGSSARSKRCHRDVHILVSPFSGRVLPENDRRPSHSCSFGRPTMG
jgi:hypothetical protein